ncbi:MFS transporter [Sandarakinorhabdus cyanobacteriorum]|uniref:MFS transporter n=2 Tax=Sandarakinorhabdus cyanobacteriorum TaxID=1981098 RepID=A0A255YD01_9SPHN|nr:MFS transporter [Sandarakinorhabdus cyanobacteriorum]OYQ26435.1 MFS transporter [Sandarakinorhabdus cyanobacteriorum]
MGMADQELPGAESPGKVPAVGGPYASYVLALLVLVYVFNFIDRQILSILAEDIKRDLNLSDAQLGFLYGTAFAVFYALFGVPIGRLADNWVRTRLLSFGLTLWSGMTALSGLAGSFTQLSLARIGVGVGEATAGPSAYSMISDWFPKARRATALSIYAAGLYLGGGVSLLIGAVVVKGWNTAYPDGGPLGLVGWQAAFMAVGIPGLLLALWVATLIEPIRGRADGLPPPVPMPGRTIIRNFLADMASVIPPLTLVNMALLGRRALLENIAALVLVAGLVATLVHFTGEIPQFLAVGTGLYAVISWAQSIKRRDKPTYEMIWGTPAFVLTIIGFGSISFVGYSVGFWAAPYAMRSFVEPMAASGAPVPWYGTKEAVAFLLGGGGALGGFIGTILGGVLGDAAKKRHPSGRIIVGSLATLVPAPFIWLQYTTTDLATFFLCYAPTTIFGSMYVGVAAATTQDLVMPRMRGAATATFFIGTTLFGLGLGPWFTGFVSKLSGSLGTGVLSLLLMAPVTITCLLLVYRWLPAAEASRITRARTAGEIIGDDVT